ncbi:hypothetical protein LTR53_014726 [Teratosphaeriaceae sp. CCFEE 6253]|nr:hypothetical protein LTR53_014726 [Teratosphaeriaceae sp. CCFEE 6253]
MQYTILAVSAFAASVLAQDTTAAAASINPISLYSVLQTALPSSLVAEALTNSAAASSEIAAQFAAGQTPTWFSALPSDIKTYLVPLATNPAALSSAAGNVTGAANATGILGGNGTAIGGVAQSSSAALNSSASSVVAVGSSSSAAAGMASMTASGAATSASASAASATGASGSSSTASAAGAIPTAVVGMGLAGVVGFVGLLAL